MTMLLGLPGLYENWLMTVLDVESKTFPGRQQNFCSTGTKTICLEKLTLNLGHWSKPVEPVVNCYVEPKNFVWYLYNFLEKTDGVDISISNMKQYVLTKAPNTVALRNLLEHFVNSYEQEFFDHAGYIDNALIEYFYFFLRSSNHFFVQQAQWINSECINIEYRDFECVDRLIDKLSGIQDFDCNKLQNLHDSLVKHNKKYLDRPRLFVQRLQRHESNFDFLEWALIGVLIERITGTQLDWFNTKLRCNLLEQHYQNICSMAQDVLV